MMPTKNLHGVTLWAVPRFHRSEVASGNNESGTEWVNRLKTYSFPLLPEEQGKMAALPDQPQTCH
jgi:hypothetical protein